MAEGQLSKTYEPHQVEQKWYRLWLDRGYFRLPPEAASSGGVFCLTIPPPNVTGSLHMGHALQHSIHDAIARWRRLCGDRVLVVPGTDHAAISTNMKVEQSLAEEGVSRLEIGREAFLERCWEWTRRYGGEIINQLTALGCSYDWEREQFTLDDHYYRAVLEAFVRCYQRGWIYRGHRVVNWCATCASTVSDLEVQHDDHQGRLWHIRYPVIDGEGDVVVATTRPETMLGDTAVAVHSQDPRYRSLHGKQVMLPLMNRPLPIICDDVLVDPEFGTGAVKVTPAHDLNDFEAGARNQLDTVVVIGTDAKMTEAAGPYAGLDRYQARERVLEDLEAQGLLVKTEDYVYPIGRHDRCQTVLEPLLSEQWFLRMKELAEMAREALAGDDPSVSYLPERFRRYTLEWLDNLRDWNISRQIWWGHRIPVYTCITCGEAMAQVEPPAACSRCGGEVAQDPDTLDTWFSSALWPFAVLGWPDEAKLQESCEAGLYPTAILNTARDIIYLWVVRMIMTGLEFTGRAPFRGVLVHPTVLDIEGRRMSKSLGTGIDPLELIAAYGSDATRFSLLYQCAADQDIRFGEERTEMARNFCNKIWNASRFVLMNLGEDFAPAADTPARILREGALADRWILSRYHSALSAVSQSLDRLEMATAARALYDFFWSEFCDWFVEMCKPALRAGGEAAAGARQTLWFVLDGALRALHPFVPFITEEIWQQLPGGGESLMRASWPEAQESWLDPEAEQAMAGLMNVVIAARKLRADQEVPAGDRVTIAVACGSERARSLLKSQAPSVLLLARGRELEFSDDPSDHPAMAELTQCCGEAAAVWIARKATREEMLSQRDRLQQELSRLQKEAAVLDEKLRNEGFVSKAPPHVVERARARKAETEAKRAAIEAQLEDLQRALSASE